MSELDEIMEGKHKIEHIHIEGDTIAFETELDSHTWNLSPRDIEIIIYCLQKENNKQKEVLDKIKEYCKNKIEEQKNMTDFSKYYLENYDKAINIQHLSHSGVMLETIKSTTIKRYEDILELLEEIE